MSPIPRYNGGSDEPQAPAPVAAPTRASQPRPPTHSVPAAAPQRGWRPEDYIGYAIAVAFGGAIAAGVVAIWAPDLARGVGAAGGVLATIWLAIGIIGKGVQAGNRHS